MDFINIGNIFLNDGLKFFNLANLYYYGISVEANLKTAYELYLKSASLGVSEAQNMLGILYFNGHGTDVDIDESINYFEKAKNQGNTTAMFNLAMIYMNIDEKKDYKKAHDYLQKLINLGYSLASDALGYMYYEGIGEEKNYEKALNYWNKKSYDKNTEAIDKKSINSSTLSTEPLEYIDDDQYIIGTMDNFEDLSLENLESKSINNFSTESSINDAFNEKFLLADNYYYGNNVDIDYVKAFEIYNELAEAGNINAQIKIANMYKDGLGVDQDYAKSIEWYSKTLGMSK